MICFTQAIKNDAGAVVYLGCYKVMLEAKVYDWEIDGLPPHVKKRALKILEKAIKCYKGISS
jgi:hypothetical protein